MRNTGFVFVTIHGVDERIVNPLKEILVKPLKRDRCYSLCNIQRFTFFKNHQRKTIVYLCVEMGVIRPYESNLSMNANNASSI